ncbi:DUF397 domain-containing protein [Nocardiopsis sp. EMB25]|uniref:DUF397 domain-containing protein n=1 Tax=Nocardiopsis sp. EMB25 TaxID=2835867 RepID=UPI002283A116|nr:DUF397 domain-containing protein [Nocardiopsis sp. EMB25]MCY9784955.1 DUF397 domain-containing protein [Nocardiopsis sp. EMB25]
MTTSSREPAGAWFTSSYSSGNGQCVQVRHQPEGAAVRDSVHPGKGTLNFSAVEWTSFLEDLKAR